MTPRYKLRTLLILLAAGPLGIASVVWFLRMEELEKRLVAGIGISVLAFWLLSRLIIHLHTSM